MEGLKFKDTTNLLSLLFILYVLIDSPARLYTFQLSLVQGCETMLWLSTKIFKDDVIIQVMYTVKILNLFGGLSMYNV